MSEDFEDLLNELFFKFSFGKSKSKVSQRNNFNFDLLFTSPAYNSFSARLTFESNVFLEFAQKTKKLNPNLNLDFKNGPRETQNEKTKDC